MSATNTASGAYTDLPSGARSTKLVNQLASSRSPYVRGHADNATAWQLWTTESLALAKKENKLIFLSIGYAACHWCHVMERESFQDTQVAEILNENFIPIKLDREERPDIDRIYMNYVQATTGSGGWPLNVFLTPDLEPVFGGTYWPGPNAVDGPAMRDQMGFLEVLDKIAKVWNEQEERCLASAKDILHQLQEFTDDGLKGDGGNSEDSPELLEIDLLEEAYQHFLTRYDQTYGGFGIAPKFPTPVNLSLLLRLGTFPSTVEDIVGDMECENAKEMALVTLRNMNKGGIHDHIGHGFARYSVTPDWSLPHFEKMLYDNAQLLGVYLDGYLVSKDQEMLDAALDCADYLCFDSLRNPGGGFFSAEDADSYYRKADTEKREGAFYVWDRKEFTRLLGEQDSEICAKYWNVKSHGNVDPSNDAHDEFIHQNVLAITSTPTQLSQSFGISESKITDILKKARKTLREHRETERPRPNLDDKIITSWNGLAIGSLARAALVLETIDSAKSKTYLKNAVDAALFIQKNLYNSSLGLLKRVWREGPGDTPGFADDYAYLIQGLLCLYEATYDLKWLRWASDLQATQTSLFWDKEHGGFFSTEKDAADLILRLKDGMDSAEPSTNGVSASNLYRLSSLLNQPELSTLGSKTASAFSTELLQHPFLFSSMLPSVVASNLGANSVVLIGQADDPEIVKWRGRLRERLMSNTAVVWLDPTIEGGEDVKWLLERNELLNDTLKVGKSKGRFIQICQGQRCIDSMMTEEFEQASGDLS